MDTAALLRGIQRLTQPYTAPYHESATRAALRAWLTDLGLASSLDAYGNTWVRLHRGQARRRVAMLGHLDHPALQVEHVRGRVVRCSALGGLPTVGLRGTHVRFPYTRQGSLVGTVHSARIRKHPARPRLEQASIHMPARSGMPEPGDVGVFDLPACRRRGHRLLLRCADDLVGCAAMVGALMDLRASAGDPNFASYDVTALFTRAEEVGLHGALSIAYDGLLPADTLVVSVECSKAYGHIAVGKGPVVRQGDRAGPFTPSAYALARAAAHSVDGLHFQEGAMTAGTCEATAFLAFGYACTGVALPLANYHNQGPHGVAPEEIDLRDLHGARRLLAAICARAGGREDDLNHLRNDLILASDGGRRRLRGGMRNG